MAERKSVRLTKEQLSVIEDMDGSDLADNESEAHRMLLNAGMKEYGYRNGQYRQTALRELLGGVGKLLLVVGMTALSFTLFYPVPLRFASLAILVTGVVVYYTGEIVEKHEPAITDRLKNVVGGETA